MSAPSFHPHKYLDTFLLIFLVQRHFPSFYFFCTINNCTTHRSVDLGNTGHTRYNNFLYVQGYPIVVFLLRSKCDFKNFRWQNRNFGKKWKFWWNTEGLVKKLNGVLVLDWVCWTFAIAEKIEVHNFEKKPTPGRVPMENQRWKYMKKTSCTV